MQNIFPAILVRDVTVRRNTGLQAGLEEVVTVCFTAIPGWDHRVERFEAWLTLAGWVCVSVPRAT